MAVQAVTLVLVFAQLVIRKKADPAQAQWFEKISHGVKILVGVGDVRDQRHARNDPVRVDGHGFQV